MTGAGAGYLATLTAMLAEIPGRIGPQMEAAAEAMAAAIRADGLVYVFGTGHSHMLAEEVLYRAGGLAATVPILASALMLHEGAVSGSALERTPGLAAALLARYPVGAGDVLIVISNSGVNAAPLEAARFGRERGARVIALTSLAYSQQAASGGTRLAELADIVLDNGIPPGDAIAPLPGTDLRAGPASTVIGAAILNAIFVDVAARLAKGGQAPVYRSANMPGAAELNGALVDRYRPRNPHL